MRAVIHNADALSARTREAFEVLTSRVNSVFSDGPQAEHNADGTHGDVTAESVTTDVLSAGTGSVDGTLTVAGDLSVAGAVAVVGAVSAGTVNASGSVSSGTLVLAGTGVSERSRTASMGEWIAVAYNAGDFTGSGGMTWTVDAGDVSVFRYMLIGKTMFVDGVWNTTSVTAPLGTMLKVLIPGGFVAANPNRASNQATDSGVITTSQVRVDAASTTIDILRQDGANWTASVNTTSVRVHTWFEVQ